MPSNLKLGLGWIVTYVLFIIIFLFFGTIFIHASLAVWFNVPFVGSIDNGIDKAVIYLSGLILCVCPFLFWLFKTQDVAYVEKVKISLDKFVIHDYCNSIVLVYKKDNFAWSLDKSRYRTLKVENIKFISGTNYYNKDKKFLHFALTL